MGCYTVGSLFSSMFWQSLSPRSLLTHLPPKLAEAILSEHTPTDSDDMGSIRLADSRTRDEQQFLVGDDQDQDEVRSRSPSLDREGGRGRGRSNVMGNAAAQLSRLDVNATNADPHEDDVRKNVSGDGLSAKAGVILVNILCL